MRFLQDIKSIFIDDFQAGAEEISDLPVVFVDPNKLHHKEGGVHPDALNILKDMINEQKPGLGDKFTDDDVIQHLQQGQFSSKRKFQGEDLCIINMPTSDRDHKNEMAPFLSNNDLDRIKSIPGADSHWDRIIGMHEGAHCNQDTSDSSGFGILRLEIGADQAAIDWLVENNLNDIAQAFKDYRTLGASSGIVQGIGRPGDLQHATGSFLNLRDGSPHLPMDLLDKNMHISEFQSEITKEVALLKGIEHHDAEMMRYDDPKKFAEAAQDAIDKGQLKRPNPYTEKLAQDYIKSFDGEKFAPIERPPLGKALIGFEEKMMQEVMTTHNISEFEAQKMRHNDPEKFITTLEDALGKGRINTDPAPYTEAIIRDYTESFRRQIIETKPKPQWHNPHASAENNIQDKALLASNVSSENFKVSDNGNTFTSTPTQDMDTNTPNGVTVHSDLSSVLPPDATLTVQSNAPSGVALVADIVPTAQINVINDNGNVIKLEQQQALEQQLQLEQQQVVQQQELAQQQQLQQNQTMEFKIPV